MQKLFDELNTLDERCCKEFGLSEDILMEHASNTMAIHIRKKFSKKRKITIVCGSGNNGADGIALSRLLHKEYLVNLILVKKPKSKMAKLQLKRSMLIGVNISDQIDTCDVIVDAILGTGFIGKLDNKTKNILKQINEIKAYKIACDIPSGLLKSGVCEKETFRADISITMGALKKSMFLDEAKQYVGKIKVADLGISREIYETDTSWNLLDLDDLRLPYRLNKNSHKGSFGHLVVVCGEKSGAGIISSQSALRFGSGLVTMLKFNNEQIPFSIMSSSTIPKNATALAIGMGLGNIFNNEQFDKCLNNELAIIADADILNMDIIKKIFKRKNVVITPHPKEFCSLLDKLNLANISIKELQENRFKYTELFCKKFPDIILLLKGSNTIIAKDKQFFINPHGNQSLAKGGSGDVLSGLIGALLAQGQEPLNASINASLAHTKLAINYKGNNFSLTPEDLIDGISML